MPRVEINFFFCIETFSIIFKNVIVSPIMKLRARFLFSYSNAGNVSISRTYISRTRIKINLLENLYYISYLQLRSKTKRGRNKMLAFYIKTSHSHSKISRVSRLKDSGTAGQSRAGLLKLYLQSIISSKIYLSQVKKNATEARWDNLFFQGKVFCPAVPLTSLW